MCGGQTVIIANSPARPAPLAAPGLAWPEARHQWPARHGASSGDSVISTAGSRDKKAGAAARRFLVRPIVSFISQWPSPGISGSSVTSGGPPCANTAPVTKEKTAAAAASMDFAKRRWYFCFKAAFEVLQVNKGVEETDSDPPACPAFFWLTIELHGIFARQDPR